MKNLLLTTSLFLSINAIMLPREANAADEQTTCPRIETIEQANVPLTTGKYTSMGEKWELKLYAHNKTDKQHGIVFPHSFDDKDRHLYVLGNSTTTTNDCSYAIWYQKHWKHPQKRDVQRIGIFHLTPFAGIQ